MNKNNYMWIVYVFILVLVPTVSAVTNINYVSDINIIRGELNGSVEQTFINDGDYLEVREVIGTNGLNFILNISDVKGNLSNFIINERYNGGAGHSVVMSIMNGGNWLVLDTFTSDVNFELKSYDISFLGEKDEVLLLFNHVEDGDDNHVFDIDYLLVTSEYVETEKDLGLFKLDFNNTFTIVLFGLLLLISVYLYFVEYSFLSGCILSLLGLLLIFNDNYLLIGIILFLIGFLAILKEDN